MDILAHQEPTIRSARPSLLTCRAVSRTQHLAAGRHFVLRNDSPQRVKYSRGAHYLEINVARESRMDKQDIGEPLPALKLHVRH